MKNGTHQVLISYNILYSLLKEKFLDLEITHNMNNIYSNHVGFKTLLLSLLQLKYSPFLLQLQSKSSSVPIRNTRSIENIYTLHPWLQFKFAPESDASNPAGIPRQSFSEFLHENDGGGGCGWHRMGSDNKTRSPPLR